MAPTRAASRLAGRPRRGPDPAPGARGGRLLGTDQAQRRAGRQACSTTTEVAEGEIERLKQGDLLEVTFAEFARSSPPLYEALIAERDRYMAAALRQHAAEWAGGRVLVVVGAGHLEGIARELASEQAAPDAVLAPLRREPPPSHFARWFGIFLVGVRARRLCLGLHPRQRDGLRRGRDLGADHRHPRRHRRGRGRRAPGQHRQRVHRLAAHAAASGPGFGHGQRRGGSVGAQAHASATSSACATTSPACAAGGATGSRACSWSSSSPAWAPRSGSGSPASAWRRSWRAEAPGAPASRLAGQAPASASAVPRARRNMSRVRRRQSSSIA